MSIVLSFSKSHFRSTSSWCVHESWTEYNRSSQE